jgi:RNase adapter protein RapZ
MNAEANAKGSSTTLVIVVTGVSGAGKSTAVHALEDLGFFCVDNLPTPIVQGTLDSFAAAGVRRIALGIDVRVRGFLGSVSDVLESLNVPGERELAVLYLDASDEALLRRFSSTRRPHPLSTTLEPGSEQAGLAVLDGVRIERELLAPLRARATVVIDTTRLSVHDLRRQVLAHFGPRSGRVPRLQIRLVSFGFKFGSPVDADLLFDVRFIRNPYFEPTLKDLPGSMPAVQSYVFAEPEAEEYVRHVQALLEFCLPRFEREGRSYVTIGVGCTGGRHRSVVIADRLGKLLTERSGLSLDVVHRDVDRVTIAGPAGDPDHSAPRFDGGSQG